MSPALFVIATPLGNLEDLSPRAARTLREADVIAAEDTRRTMKLLSHLGISKPLISYWGPKEKAKTRDVLDLLAQGKNVALVSDAGTPGVSDPGRVVVEQAAAHGYSVVPIPGPSGVTTAVSISGFDGDRFRFAGFLPPKRGARRRALEDMASEPFTIVLYEAPHRILDALCDMEEVLGPERRAVVTRELTKIHEEVLRGSLAEILDRMQTSTVAGEYVIVVEGRKPGETLGIHDAVREMTRMMRHGVSRKDAAAKIAQDYGLSKKTLYDASLAPPPED